MRKTLKIKPLSRNKPESELKAAYYKEIARQLPKSIRIKKKRLAISYDVWLSNESADLGNVEKWTADAICKAYNLQDANFYDIHLHRNDCEKGKEKIVINLTDYKGVNMEKLKPYAELIKFLAYGTIGIFIGEYIDLIKGLSLSIT